MSSGRHPKKEISSALSAVARPGLKVVEIHRGHRWDALICTDCGADLALYSTPRVPENTAKNIRKFDLAHRHDRKEE